jgi:hypothetical protein
MSLPFNPLQLQTYDITQKDQARMFVLQLANMLNQAFTPNGIAAILANSAALIGALGAGSVGAAQVSTSLSDLGSPAGNSTIDTKGAQQVAVRVNWTTAANWTLTLNNLTAGANVWFRLINSSGASRTFTVLANNPTPTAYTVALISSTGTSTLSAGVTVTSGAGIKGFGMAYLIGGAPELDLFGVNG